MFQFIRDRELKTSANPFVKSHEMYRNIYPNHTTYNSPTPSVQIRKFSPCGRYLVTFGQNLHSVRVFDYTSPSTSLTFTDFFQDRWETILTSGTETLCFDFCIFTSQKTHVIVSSAKPSSIRKKTPESLGCIPNLDDITFFVLELKSGIVTDQLQFLGDFMFLGHHAAVHLYKDYFCVTSIQHQTITIHHVTNSGKLVKEVELGYFTFQDDSLYLAMHDAKEFIEEEEEAIPQRYQYVPNYHQVPSTGNTLNLVLTIPETNFQSDTGLLGGLKQRIMSFLYRQAKAVGTQQALAHFHLMFSYFTSLVMWRCQFLDSDSLLIKYGTIHNVLGKVENQGQTCFVFYSISASSVFGVYESTSEEMLEMLMHYDFFRNCAFPEDPYMGISVPSNSSHARELVQRQLYAIRQSRNGGALQATRRIVSTLPMNPQSFSESPYFDVNLYSFDERVIGPSERFRPSSDFSCKFFDRKTGALKFKLDTNIAPLHQSRNGQKYLKLTRKMCYFVFHPIEPFVISIQQSIHQSHCTNIHSWIRIDRDG